MGIIIKWCRDDINRLNRQLKNPRLVLERYRNLVMRMVSQGKNIDDMLNPVKILGQFVDCGDKAGLKSAISGINSSLKKAAAYAAIYALEEDEIECAQGVYELSEMLGLDFKKVTMEGDSLLDIVYQIEDFRPGLEFLKGIGYFEKPKPVGPVLKSGFFDDMIKKD